MRLGSIVRKKAVASKSFLEVPVDYPRHRAVKLFGPLLDKVAIPLVRLERYSVLRCHNNENIRKVMNCQDNRMNPLALSYSMRYDMNMETTEIWRPVPGFEGLYDASDIGRVKNLCSGVIYPTAASVGHPYHSLSAKDASGRIRCSFVHVFVLSAFCGARPTGMVANHKNGDKKDNRIENLEWVSKGMNSAHGWYLKRTGVRPGERIISAFDLCK